MSEKIDKRFHFPWYSKGLQFSCTQCGKCCTGSPGFVWVTEIEMEEMATFLSIDLKTFKRLYVRRMGHRYLLIEKKSQNHSCVFYKDRQCTVYSARPSQCKTYPFWQENVLSEKSWQETAKVCEGINPQAPLVTFETIENCLVTQRELEREEHYVPNDAEE